MSDEKEEKKETPEDPHFIKPIDYSPEEDWRSDFVLGQVGAKSHGHMALSGGTVFFLRDEQGKVIVKDGVVVLSEESKDGKEPPNQE